ncbi:hypothetical protein MOKP125_35630 [Mycobacterium avium subsp. hominissuis]
MAVEFTAVVDADDVRMPQRRGQIGLPVESFAKLGIDRHRLGEHLDHVAARQPGMQSQVHLGHTAGAQLPQNGVPGERRSVAYRQSRPAGLAIPLRRCGFRVRTGIDRRDPAKQLPDGHAGQRLKARAQRRAGLSRVAQQSPPGPDAPGSSLVLVHVCLTPSSPVASTVMRIAPAAGPDAVCVHPSRSNNAARQWAIRLGRL